MPRLLKFQMAGYGNPVFINPTHVASVRPVSEGAASIYCVGEAEGIYVEGSVDQVASIISDALE